VAGRKDNKLGVGCLGGVDQGASWEVGDDPVFHEFRRGAERVADRFAEEVLGDGPVVVAGEPGSPGLTAGDQPRSAGYAISAISLASR
jgi:hypothetical protein